MNIAEMYWQKASEATIERMADYVVRTNGGEWRDVDLCIWKGWMVSAKLEPQIVRGRPEWIAKVTNTPKLAPYSNPNKYQPTDAEIERNN